MKKNQRFYHVLRYALDAVAIAVAFVFIQDLYHVSNASLFFQVIFVVIFTSTWYFASIYSKLYAERRSNKFSEEIIFIFYNSVLFSVLISAILYFLQPSINLPFLQYLRFIGTIFLLATTTKYIHRK